CSMLMDTSGARRRPRSRPPGRGPTRGRRRASRTEGVN
ncbi:MAG: hypothetical protein AVDCRST_MAG19-4478, partial [uncultured Thermomicrobiales bacterium]